MTKMILLLSIFCAFSAFAGSELNCNDVVVRNDNGEMVRIEFRRLDLFGNLSTDTEVLAMDAPGNPHEGEFGVASFYVEKFSFIEEIVLAEDLVNKVYGVKFKVEDYLIKRLKLPTYIYGVCTQTNFNISGL